MYLAQFLADETLLTYSTTTSPLPLHASPPTGAPTLGAVTVVVSNSSDEVVTAQEISFQIQIGDPNDPQAWDLTEVDGGFTTEVQGNWKLDYEGEGTFVGRPLTDDAARITTQGIGFTISHIEVSRRVGTSTLIIAETAATATQPPETRLARVQVAKFPPGFVASDLSADTTEVENGQTVRLTWAGSQNATYTMYWGNRKENVTGTRAWTSPPLHNTTTFRLVVQAQQGGETVEAHFAITVIVSNPSLVAHDLEVQGSTLLHGVKVDGDAAIGGGLSIQGRASFQGEAAFQAGLVDQSGGPVMPRGGIILWSGRADQVPQGWALCNGAGGTPDLRGRFVVGFNPDDGDYAAVGATGGAARVTLNTDQMPAHAHSGATAHGGDHSHWTEGTNANGLAWRGRHYPGETTVWMGNNWGGGSNPDPQDVRWRGGVGTNTSGGHSHAFNTNPAGGGQAHENRPPYLVLAYIMKL